MTDRAVQSHLQVQEEEAVNMGQETLLTSASRIHQEVLWKSLGDPACASQGCSLQLLVSPFCYVRTAAHRLQQFLRESTLCHALYLANAV